jgi:hypothetical protein
MGVALVPGEGGKKDGRLALVGDADFASDAYISLLGNKDLLVSILGWLSEEQAVGARPQEAATKLGPVSPVFVSDRLARVIFVTTVIAQPLLFLVVGAVVVTSRRRRR